MKQLVNSRGKKDYQEWREYVLARDGYRCQYSNCKNVDKLEVHHIRRFTDAKYLRVAKFNGIALCEKCHTKVTGNEKAYEFQFFKIAIANEKVYKRKLREKADKDSGGYEGTGPIDI